MAMESWLNKKFIEKVLRRSENDDSICVTKLLTKPATSTGDNYASEIIRISVDLIRRQSAETIEEKRSIIVKVELAGNGIQKKMIELAGLFDLEIEMMTTLLKDMNSILKNTKLSSKCLFVQKKNPALLILEDLAVYGFRMADRQGGLDLQHSIIAAGGLAKLHASSVAILEKNRTYKDKFCKGLFHPDRDPEVTKFFEVAMRSLARAVTSWPEIDASISEKLMKMSEVVRSKVSDCEKLDDNEFNVINHGDFWVNNMLFKYDNNGGVIDHVMVDFQLSFYGSPGIDLNYFLTNSLSKAASNHQEEIIEAYLKVLSTTMRELECKTQSPNMAELKIAMQKREIWSLLSASAVLPLVLIDKSQAQTGEEMMLQDESTFNAKEYANILYRTAMSKKLRRWNETGLLDI